jgi:hypothetical protein
VSPIEERRARVIRELTDHLTGVETRLEEVLRRVDPETSSIVDAALQELSAARFVVNLLSETSAGDCALSDLGILVRQADESAPVQGGRAGGARVALGAAAVHAVLESVVRCERSNSPTISAVAVGRRARVTVESTAEPFDPADRDRLLDPLRLRNPAELGGGLAFSACAEIVRRAGGSFTLGGDDHRSFTIELPLVGPVRPTTT